MNLEKLNSKEQKMITKFEDSFEGTLRYNLVLGTMEYDGKILSPKERSMIDNRMDMQNWNLRQTNNAINLVGHKNEYHPIREYFDNLPAIEGMYSPIERLISCLHFKAEDQKYSEVVIKTWLVHAVEKVLRLRDDTMSHQNPVWVMTGPQGVGKSSLAAWLGSSLQEYFTEGPLDPEKIEHQRRSCSKFLWEVSEVGSSTRKADMEAMKSYLTTAKFSYRLPYDKDETERPSICSYIATYNPAEGFLVDPTGHRRWAITDIQSIDFAYTDIDVNELWSEAYTLLKNGYSLHHTEEVQNHLKAKAGLHEVQDAMLEYLELHFERDDFNVMLTTEILEALAAKGVVVHPQHNVAARNISSSLRKFGCENKRMQVGGSKMRGWIGIKPK